MKLILDRGGAESVFSPVGNGNAQTLFVRDAFVAPIDLTQASQVTKAGVARSVIKANLMIPTATILSGSFGTSGAYQALPKSAAFEAHLVLSAPRTVVQLCHIPELASGELSVTEAIISELLRAVITAATNGSLLGSADGGPDGLLANGGMPIVQSLTGKQAFDPVSGTYGESA